MAKSNQLVQNVLLQSKYNQNGRFNSTPASIRTVPIYPNKNGSLFFLNKIPKFIYIPILGATLD